MNVKPKSKFEAGCLLFVNLVKNVFFSKCFSIWFFFPRFEKRMSYRFTYFPIHERFITWPAQPAATHPNYVIHQQCRKILLQCAPNWCLIMFEWKIVHEILAQFQQANMYLHVIMSSQLKLSTAAPMNQ